MLAGVFGKKIGMTQMFDTNGFIIAVTLVQIFYCQVSQKLFEKDGKFSRTISLFLKF